MLGSSRYSVDHASPTGTVSLPFSFAIVQNSRVTTRVNGDARKFPMYQETLPPIIPDVVVPFIVFIRETTGELASQGRESGARRFKNDLDADGIVLRGRDKIGGGPGTVVKGNELVSQEVGPFASK